MNNHPASRVRMHTRRKYYSYSGYLFILPLILFVFVFSIYPFFYAFDLSLQSYNFVRPPHLVGLANYARLLGDGSFYQALVNTIYYLASTVPLQLVLSLLLALLLLRDIRFGGTVRVLYFVPVVTSIVIVAKIWSILYAPDGLINMALGAISIPGPNWLEDPAWAMPAVILMSVWKGVGYTAILYLAGLQAIPSQYYEAATIDGASSRITFFRITLPLLAPTTFFILVILVIGAFKAFAQFMVMTGGGPVNSTTTLGVYIYQQAFSFLKLGFASAAAVVFFVIVFALTLIQWNLNRGGKEGVL